MFINLLIFGKLWQIREEQRDPDTDVVIARLFGSFMLTLVAWPALLLIPLDAIRVPRVLSWIAVLAVAAVSLISAWPLYVLAGFVAATIWLIWFVWENSD